MFVAPLPARFLHLQFGRLAYWAFTLASSAALAVWQPQWALFQFTLLLVVGLFTDLEQLHIPTFYSAIASVFISVISFILLVTAWARFQGTRLVAFLNEHLAEALTAAGQMQNVETTIKPEYILSMMPALLSIMLMFLIFVSLVFVRSGRREPLTAFKTPDVLIWPTIMTLAGTFLINPDEYFYAQKLSANLLYIFGAAYYFQGLSVLGFFFKRFRMNYFLKAVIFFVLGFHLFMVVIGIGVSDFWFNYRKTWYKGLMKRESTRRTK